MAGRVRQLYGCLPILTNLHSSAMLLIGLQHTPASWQLCSAMYACLPFTRVESRMHTSWV